MISVEWLIVYLAEDGGDVHGVLSPLSSMSADKRIGQELTSFPAKSQIANILGFANLSDLQPNYSARRLAFYSPGHRVSVRQRSCVPEQKVEESRFDAKVSSADPWHGGTDHCGGNLKPGMVFCRGLCRFQFISACHVIVCNMTMMTRTTMMMTMTMAVLRGPCEGQRTWLWVYVRGAASG